MIGLLPIISPGGAKLWNCLNYRREEDELLPDIDCETIIAVESIPSPCSVIDEVFFNQGDIFCSFL